MNRGVLQNSSLVQQIMAGGNPNLGWNVTGICSPPPIQPPNPPIFFGATAPSNLFPDQLYVPTASSASSSSSSSSSSWQDMNNPKLPDSRGQLLLGGLEYGEYHRVGDQMSHFQDQQSPNCPSAMNHVKQENSTSSYNNTYIDPNDQQDFRLGSVAKPRSPVAPVSSSARSCTTSIETDNFLDFSENKSSTVRPLRDRVHECNRSANGGPRKKAKLQPCSTFKIGKEKLGDKITALHQLVSPYGKADTASVLLEAVGYIRFLHSQIQALGLPYLAGWGSGNPRQPNSKELLEAEKGKDLRSRGLCLVPISCTVQLGSENDIGADYWAAATSFGSGGISFH